MELFFEVQIGERKAKLTAENIEQHFAYVEAHKVLVCREHATAMRNVDAHLREHHGVQAKERRRILEKYSGLFIETDPDKIVLPSLSSPIAALAVLDGFRCAQEGCAHMTINKNGMKQHWNKAHGRKWTNKGEGAFTAVKMQTFFNSSGLQRYFQVETEARAGPKLHAGTGPQATAILAEMRQVQEELKQKREMMAEEVAKQDKTGWFVRTGWPELLKGMNMGQLARAVQLPQRNEPELQKLKTAVTRAVEYSVAGLATLPRELRRWLRSAKREEPDVRPMARLQSMSGQARYVSYVVMFLCCVIRLAMRPDDEALQDARRVVRLTDAQQEMALALRDALAGTDEALQVRCVFDLMVTVTAVSYTGSPHECALVAATALLGIDAQMLRLRTPRNLSYVLAGLVYCVRVMSVARMLPSDQRAGTKASC